MPLRNVYYTMFIDKADRTQGDTEMNFLTAWEAYIGNIFDWLKELLGSGNADENDTVWLGDDGSYIISDWIEDPDELHTDYTDKGTVAEWLAGREEDF